MNTNTNLILQEEERRRREAEARAAFARFDANQSGTINAARAPCHSPPA